MKTLGTLCRVHGEQASREDSVDWNEQLAAPWRSREIVPRRSGNAGHQRDTRSHGPLFQHLRCLLYTLFVIFERLAASLDRRCAAAASASSASRALDPSTGGGSPSSRQSGAVEVRERRVDAGSRASAIKHTYRFGTFAGSCTDMTCIDCFFGRYYSRIVYTG